MLKFFIYQIKNNMKRQIFQLYRFSIYLLRKFKVKEIKINENFNTKKDCLILNLIESSEFFSNKNNISNIEKGNKLSFNHLDELFLKGIRNGFISLVYKDCFSSIRIVDELDYYFSNYKYELEKYGYLYYLIKSEFELLKGNMNDCHKYLNKAYESSVLNYSLNSEESLMILSKFMGLYFQIGESEEAFYFMEIIYKKLSLIKKTIKKNELKDIFFCHYTDVNNNILSLIKIEINQNFLNENIDINLAKNRLVQLNSIFNFNKSIMELSSKTNYSNSLQLINGESNLLDIMFKIDYIQSYAYISIIFSNIISKRRITKKESIVRDVKIFEICKNQQLCNFIISFVDELINLLEKLSKGSNDIIILTIYEKIIFAYSNLLEIYYINYNTYKNEILDINDFKKALKNFKLIIEKYIELSHKIYFNSQTEMYYNKLQFLSCCSGILKNNDLFKQYFVSNYNSIIKFYGLKLNERNNKNNEEKVSKNKNEIQNDNNLIIKYSKIDFNYEFLLAINYLGLYNLKPETNDLLNKISVIFEKNFGSKCQKVQEIKEILKLNSNKA